MAEVNMPDLDDVKPNSHTYHRDTENNDISNPEEKKTTKVITGNVTRKKKSLWRKFIGTFLKDGDSIEDIKEYIIEEVVVPSILEMIHDSFDDGISMLFGLGTGRKKSGRGNQNVSRVNYQGCFNGGNRKNERRSSRDSDPNRHNSLDDYYFETRAEAEQARDALLDMLDQYQQVTVADYLDLIGVSSEFPDNKWGWTNLEV